MMEFKPIHLNQSTWKVAPYSHTMKTLAVRECLLNHKVLKHTVKLGAVYRSTIQFWKFFTYSYLSNKRVGYNKRVG